MWCEVNNLGGSWTNCASRHWQSLSSFFSRMNEWLWKCLYPLPGVSAISLRPAFTITWPIVLEKKTCESIRTVTCIMCSCSEDLGHSSEEKKSRARFGGPKPKVFLYQSQIIVEMKEGAAQWQVSSRCHANQWLSDYMPCALVPMVAEVGIHTERFCCGGMVTPGLAGLNLLTNSWCSLFKTCKGRRRIWRWRNRKWPQTKEAPSTKNREEEGCEF